MNLVLKTPPAIEPITLPEIKNQLKLDLDDTAEDTDLTAYLTAAREFCEGFQNRAYITQTWELSFDDWPCHTVKLPKGSLQTVDSVSYTNSDGITTELTESVDYVYSQRGILGRLTPAYGKSWPSFTPYPLDAVVIEFTCGYGDTADKVPEKVKQAMKLLVGHWHENRTPLSETGKVPEEIEFTISALLWQDRVVPI